MDWIEHRLNEVGEYRDSSDHRKKIISLVSTELAKKYDLPSDELERDLEEMIPEFKFIRQFTRTEVAVAQALSDCMNDKKPFKSKVGRPTNQELSYAYFYAWFSTNNLSATATLFGIDPKSVKRSVANLAKSLNITKMWKTVDMQVSPLDETIVEWSIVVEIENEEGNKEQYYCSELLRSGKINQNLMAVGKKLFEKYMSQNNSINPENWIVEHQKKGKTNL